MNSAASSSRFRQAVVWPTTTAAFALLSACGGGNNDSLTAPPAQAPVAALSADSCAALKSSLVIAGVQITGASVINATASSATSPALPAHCKITGAIDQRVGVDNLPYAIKFQILAPLGNDWNKKFLFIGGGGSNGVVGDGLSAQGVSTSPLSRGYAILTQDSGHDNTVDNLPAKSGTRTFGFDFQARVDNGYRSYDRATVVAKQIIKSAYGQSPEHSYFAGCSEGGREALMVTQRFPTYFDGVVAGAPQLAAPFASLVRPAHILQTYATLAKKQGNYDRNGLPFLNNTFTDADLAVLTKGITAACDALDGAVDGISSDFQACTAAFDPAKLQCAAGQTSGCLTPDQVTALKTQMAGIPGDVRWYWDIGMVPGQLRSWWIGPSGATQNNATMGNSAFVTSYTTPPPAIDMVANNGSEPFRSMLNFDLSKDVFSVFTATDDFPESVWNLTYATNPDLSAFRSRGGKIVVFQGQSDGAFTIDQTIAYLRDVDSMAGGTASQFMRLFAVPNMGHCGGGNGTTSFDMLQALENWVEKGQAPDSVLATAPAGTPWPGRTRPLCPYPKVARYKGSGSIEDAASFSCQ
ncbi:tannase/feruloyl esterase family alpha/beta hydrolase (plasmid) [Paraburkholderia sp. PREW-6R]|uniref:tannase/feruloyl esterase family alpha/beta hydrolase n=1 Tax=Paraburkholderia sp. PREW-6R TaxID=3141544 RepID=UPI0031F58108